MVKTWVMGKVHPGWYVAYNGWSSDYAKHLESLGYEVKKSINIPE